MPHMTNSPDPKKEIERQQVAADVAAFLAGGGKIEAEEIKERGPSEHMTKDDKGRVNITINADKAAERQGWKEGK